MIITILQRFALLIFTTCCLLSTSACYRMPTDEDFSIVPMTNNPHITRESQSSNIPNVKF